jgi:hypothetical protein
MSGESFMVDLDGLVRRVLANGDLDREQIANLLRKMAEQLLAAGAEEDAVIDPDH